MSVNYIQLHIGDFLSGVMHMDGAEVGAYTMLLFAHYQAGEEGLPDDDKKLRQICKITTRSWAGVKATVLSKFYLENGRWKHKRVIDEIRKIYAKKTNKDSDKNQSGETLNDIQKTFKGNTKKNKALKENNFQNTNQEPITNNQKKDNPNGLSKKVSCPDGVSESVWSDFQTLRRSKKSPITETALAAIRREAEKLGWSIERALSECCSRGWQGFKAEWVAKDNVRSFQTKPARPTQPSLEEAMGGYEF